MDEAEIKNVVKKIEQRFIRDNKEVPLMYVRARTILGDITVGEIETSPFMTIKRTEQAIDNMFSDFEEYLNGRAVETTNYREYYQVEITFRY